MERKRVLLVGEYNPYGTGPDFALWPGPVGCSGWRLCHTILGMDEAEYLSTFDRVNLLDASHPFAGKRWPVRVAREEAARLTHPRRVLLGARVAAAHSAVGSRFRPFERIDCGADEALRWTALVLPHPSGLSRLWNDPQAVRRAREAVRALLDDPTRYSQEYSPARRYPRDEWDDEGGEA